jgi:flagellar basal-body rod protein FlgC
VQVLDVVEARAAAQVHETGQPLATPRDGVLSQHEPVAEMTDMMSASRAFKGQRGGARSHERVQRSLLKLAEG